MTDLYRRLLEAHVGRAETIPPRIAGVPAPLSLAQQHMWLLDQLTADAARMHQLRRVRLRGRLDAGALHGAFLDLQTRHEILCTRLVINNGRPFQEVMPHAEMPLPVEELRGLSQLDQDLRLSAIAVEQGRAFDLERGPLWRLALARVADEEHQLFITLHELIADGSSISILYRELAAFYAARISAASPDLPPLPIQYADYAAWQRARIDDEDFAQQLAYWRDNLHGVSPVELPTQRPIAVRSRRAGSHAVVIDAATSAAFRALCNDADATLFMALLAAFQSLLVRYTGKDDIAVGVPIANRLRRQTRPLLGRFANGLLVRTDLSGEPSFTETLRRTREAALGAFARQEIPLERIFDVLTSARASAGGVFNVMFALQGEPVRLQLGDLDVEEVWGAARGTRTDLALAVAPGPKETLVARMWFDAELLDAELVAQMAADYARLIANVVAQPGAIVADFGAAPDPASSLERTADADLPVRLDEHAASHPDSVAIALPGGVVSYGELARRTHQLAHHLLALGVRVGAPVVVLLEPSVDLVTTLAALLEIGATAVRLDPAAPGDDVRAAVADCGVRLAITSGRSLTLDEVRLLDLERVRDELARGDTTPPEIRVRADQRRSAFGARLSSLQAELALDRDDVVLHLAMTVDPAAVELMAPLAAGATLVLAPTAVPPERVTTLFVLPGQLAALLEDPAWTSWSGLRRVICAGDGLTPALQARFFARSTAALFRSYVTETGTAAIWRCAPEPHARTVPIGRGAPHMRLYVLDARLRPVPAGTEGELYVAGPQLATGYHLLPDPFGPTGTLMYRTRDRARLRLDGAVELLGRVGDQIRIRGIRVAPTDIESVIAEAPTVRQVVVVERGDRLVAYVVPNDGFDAKRVPEHVASRLPRYMVPSAIVTLAALPVDTRGRVMRAALPPPDESALVPETYVAPRTPEEQALASLWSDRLGIAHVGVHDDFFELGGHSLLAIQMVAEIERTFEVRIPLRQLFVGRTIAVLADEVAARRSTDPSASRRPPLVRTPPGERPPLSHAQERMWFLHQLEPESTAYHVALARRLRGPLDVEALRGAIEDLIDRHEALRTVFPSPDGVPYQHVQPPRRWELPLEDHRGVDARALERLALDEAHRPFDLAAGPMIRTRLIRVGDDEHVLLATLHHIVSDGWSTGIFWRELGELYTARVSGNPATLPVLPVQYTDYAAWQCSWISGDELARQLGYWKQQLGGGPDEIALPLKGPRPPLPTGRGQRVSVELDRELSTRLRALAAREGATMFMTLLAAFRALLARYAGQEDIAIGTPIANRNRREIEGLIGVFVNTLVLRNQVHAGDSFAALLEREKAVALAAYEHQDTPFELVVDALGVVRSPSRTPLFQVMYAHVGQFAATPVGRGFAGLSSERFAISAAATQVDLSLTTWQSSDQLGLDLLYSEDLFDRARIEQFARHYIALLEQISRDATGRLAQIPLLDDAERTAVREWNATERRVDPTAVVPALIEAQVDRTPDAIAMVFEGQPLTYGELDARANQLAHHLRARGVRRDEPIAVLLERSLDLVVALLAVWKAGAAYVPLDPHHPRDRLGLVLEDSRARLILTDMALAELVLATVCIIAVDRERDEIARCPSTRLGSTIAAAQLAYVIYTSGSTGRPKGVGVEHRALASLIASMQRAPGITAADTLVAVTTISFDISGLELWLPLCAGAKVVVASNEDALDPVRLARRLDDDGATILQATPSTWQMLLDAGWRGRTELVALCGGEALPESLARALAPRVRELWNLYGPTETTIWSAARAVEPDESPIVVGGPIDNTQLYVLDAWLGVVPIGVAGELCIGGDGLARGYVGQPDLTAERFVPDPFGRPGSRLYRTGDLVRRRADGTLEFLGRIDHQIKLRGFRIELGEIESVLAGHPSVRQAVVIVRGGTTLVGYVVPGDGFDVATIRDHLASKLPMYMVPAALVTLDAFPLSPAGKLDRKALPAPDDDALARDEYVAPRTPEEEILAQIWSELLGVSRVGARDDFFALGGHSLLAIRLLAEIERAFGVRIPLRRIFFGPTVASIVVEIHALRRGNQVVVDRPQLVATGARTAKLVAPQRGTYRLDQDAPANRLNRLSWSVWLDGPLDARPLERALAALRERHGILRTRFFAVDGELWQQMLEPAEVAFPLLERVDLTSLSEPEQEAADLAFHEGFTQSPFDLAGGEVMRAALVAMSPTRHRFTISLHRIVCDDESKRVVVDELARLWRAMTETPDRDPSAVLAPVPLQYLDVADYLSRLAASDTGKLQRAYWHARLSGAPPLELPIDLPRDVVDAQRDAKAGFVTFPVAFVSADISQDLLRAVHRLARSERASVQSTLTAAMAAYLSSRTGQTDLAIVSHLVYRHLPGLERALGLFSNPLVMRISAAGSPTFRELVARTHDAVIGAFEHGECDVLDLAPHRLFRLWFNYLYFVPGSDQQEIPLPRNLTATPAALPATEPQLAYDLLLFVHNHDDQMALRLAYNRELFDEAGASTFVHGYVDYIAQMCSDPDRRL